MIPDRDDNTSNSAKITIDVNGEVHEIDFLKKIVGVSDVVLFKSSIVLSINAGEKWISVRIMHPYTIWISRLVNIISLPSKQNKYGYAQAALSLMVLRAFVDRQVLQEHSYRDFMSWLNNFSKKMGDSIIRDALIDFNLPFESQICTLNVPSEYRRKYKKLVGKVSKKVCHASNVKAEKNRKRNRLPKLMDRSDEILAEMAAIGTG
ncbi:hypothetical protein [Aquitalea magnusonii]|uniref:hypothetical protein n=1 Tax=Aquitalea magnusonii TaxID=332411 RepID=UPI000B5C9906|nr:hypothetical protein [Aquitalea magnusonii]